MGYHNLYFSNKISVNFHAKRKIYWIFDIIGDISTRISQFKFASADNVDLHFKFFKASRNRERQSWPTASNPKSDEFLSFELERSSGCHVNNSLIEGRLPPLLYDFRRFHHA